MNKILKKILITTFITSMALLVPSVIIAQTPTVCKSAESVSTKVDADSVIITPNTSIICKLGTVVVVDSAQIKALQLSVDSLTAVISTRDVTITSLGLQIQNLTNTIAVNNSTITNLQDQLKATQDSLNIYKNQPVLVGINLNPDNISLQSAATQQFSVIGRLNNGNTQLVTPTFTATGGTISASGLYTAGATAGTFRVIASSNGFSDTSVVTITLPPPVLTAISITPSTITVAPGVAQSFTVVGIMSNGTTSTIVPTFTATGGTISTSGLYIAGSVEGNYSIIAMFGGFVDTSIVSIVSPPPQNNILFSSDWSTGNLLDGGKWTRWGGTSALDVVPAAGLGFPTNMVNVLRVRMGTGTFDWIQANNKWTLPAVGQSRAFRVYLRNAVGNVSGGWAATHPIESKGTDGSISGNFYAWHIGSNTSGGFPIAFGTSADFPKNYISTKNTSNSDVGTLNKSVTYLLEWKWTRTGTNTYRLDIRSTGSDGSVQTSSDWRAWGGNTIAADPVVSPIDNAFMTGIRLGINGGFSASGTQYVYWGGFAVCIDWCGAY